jgi:hypothetical protein
MKEDIAIALRFFAVTAGLVPAVSLWKGRIRGSRSPGLAFGSPGDNVGLRRRHFT